MLRPDNASYVRIRENKSNTGAPSYFAPSRFARRKKRSGKFLFFATKSGYFLFALLPKLVEKLLCPEKKMVEKLLCPEKKGINKTKVAWLSFPHPGFEAMSFSLNLL